MSVVKLASSNLHPSKRACGSCRHYGYDRLSPGLSRCLATGRYISHERADQSGICGRGGNLWEAKPAVLVFLDGSAV